MLTFNHMSGLEWIVEAHGCNPAALTDQRSLERLFGALIGGLDLSLESTFGLAPMVAAWLLM